MGEDELGEWVLRRGRERERDAIKVAETFDIAMYHLSFWVSYFDVQWLTRAKMESFCGQNC